MNYSLLCDIMRRNREYTALTAALTAPSYGKRKPYNVSGLTVGAEQVFLQALAEDFSDIGFPPIILFPNEKRAVSFCEFLRSCGKRAMYFPSREYCFLNIASSHDYEGERLSVLSSLVDIVPRKSRAEVICTTAEAVLQITLSPEELKEKCIKISYDAALDISAFTVRLINAGYTRVELVESAGQFAVRGGIVDVYPPSSQPIRIELFGDEIDRIGYFSSETQRFTEDIQDDIILAPVKELMVSEEKRDKLKDIIKKQIRRLGNDANDKNARAVEVLSSELTSAEHGFDLNYADKYLPTLFPSGTSLLDYDLGPMILVDCDEIEERAKAQNALIEQSIIDMTEHHEMPPQNNGIFLRSFDEIIGRQESPVVIVDSLIRTHSGLSTAGLFTFNTRHVPAYSGNITLFKDDLDRFKKDGYLCTVLCATESENNAISEELISEGYTVLQADKTDAAVESFSTESNTPILLMSGEFPGGFELAYPKFVLLDYSRESVKPTRGHYFKKAKKKKNATEAILSYADLTVGDIVVHEAYGIGQFMGLETLTIDGASRDYVHIKYAGSDKLFLPVDQLDHVSKYIGVGADNGMVKLSKMGGSDWVRTKSKAKAATKEMAKELIELYARRKKTKGIAFDPDDDMCMEFADSFEYEETDGQLAAIDDIRQDMEKPYPMDRLLCGDVGYGKTEVALRAAFKAVMSGKQVAVLVPTTILAYQHYQTFLSRMRAFPIKIDMVSRFRTQSEQAAAVRKVARGDTDIIIGTHRLISKDVSFFDLGLIIIDEEQRFGVAQKEKLKQLAVNADILTLTATPIPRTLNMAMGGIVDMSVLEEAPGLRSPVQTYVMEYDEALINEAIRRELRRGGQVFYLYNRVEGIYNVADRIGRAIPDARIAVAHGKLERDEIEDVWDQLIKGEIDILVCTTIIETGVDVPNANTLIIENAENYGLSQLHQIRGRVGRSSTRAFAYFTYKRGKQVSEIAEKRLAAIKEYAEFGAGFRIALRDLEIRGAGNLLGAEQHGHMEAVGYDLYMKLLDEAVVEEKGEPVKKELPECAVDIRCDAYLSQNYIMSAPQRMDMYKRIAKVQNEDDYNDIIDELCDRYGEPNSQAVNLCRIAWIRAMGRQCGFSKIEEKDGSVRLYMLSPDAVKIQRLAAAYPTLGVRVMLGQNPYITMKTKKNMRNTEFLLEVLRKYMSFFAK